MLHRLSACIVVLPVLMGLLGTAPQHTCEATPAPPPNLMQLRTQYGLTPAAEKILLQNGFLVLDQVRYKTLRDAYPLQHHVTPMYVTTDAMLELWSSLNRELLKSTERQVCIKQLSSLLPALETRAKTLYEAAHEEKERKALRQVLVTIAVSSRLLIATGHAPPYPPALRSEIDAQVQKVMAHSEATEYPGEDYTQYTVRGHYADDAALSRYFRASMWLSRRFFSVTREAGGDPDASLRAAVACAAVVRSAGPDTGDALAGLIRLRETLAGPPDAISIPQLIVALNRSVGVGWRLDRALLPTSLAALRRELARPIYPVSQVRTRIVYELGTPFPTQTVAVLPGIAVPDSVLFKQTVHPAIHDRNLPTGLEVAASLGSEAARLEIAQQEGNRSKEVLAAVDRFGAPLKADDGTTIYSGWMHALSTLSTTPKGAPDFMRNSAWQAEKLNTTLAGWAQLRHNFILYAGQNYSMTQGKQWEEPALVEANPAFYHAMAQLAGRTLKILQTAGGVDPKPAKELAAYAATCREFEVYASAELAGTLTHSQSVEIDKFCERLDPAYTGSAAAMVADVATGMEAGAGQGAEVLHAATGDLRTLLVIPDPKTGVVYTGAVLSYYEFARSGQERLTDARWQAQQTQTYLRPEPPSWSYAFMVPESGAEWQGREPLRAAEKLLVNNRTEEGLALLRATVEKNPEAALATEAQLRLGRTYFDRHELPQAERELRRCERLPGCAAFDQAQELIRQVQSDQQRHDYEQNVLAPLQAKGLAEIKRLRDAVETYRRQPLDAGRERLLVQRLIRELPWEEARNPWQAEVKALLRSTRAAVRTPPSQDAIGYALLVAEHGGRYSVGTREGVDREIAFSRRANSLPLRAAALSLALENGYLADQNKAALTLLQPFLKAQVLDNHTDPALQLILTSPGQGITSDSSSGISFRTDPRNLFRQQTAKTLMALASASLDAGQIRQAVRYAQLYPNPQSGGMNGEEFGLTSTIQEWGSIPDADLPAASMLAVLHGLESKHRAEAMAVQALSMVRRFPRSRYALIALSETIRELRGDENAAEELRLKAVLSHDYPKSIPTLCLEIETAFYQGDLTRTRRLLADYQSRSKGRDSIQKFEQDPVGVDSITYGLSQYDKLAQQLKPLLDAGHDPEIARLVRTEPTGQALAETLIKRLPDRAAEIYLNLSGFYHDPALTMRFLERFPADPRAGEAWKRLVGEDRMVTPGALNYGGPEVVEWLAPFVNRNDANSPAAAKLLKKVIGEGYGEAGIRLAQEEARMVQGRSPQSRASGVAELAVAQTLLNSHHPEAMLAYADRAMAVLAKDDPLHLEAGQLRQRAMQEIAAKHRQDWRPLWEATLRMEDAHALSEAPMPAVAYGLLLASETDEKGIRQLTAVETATGARRWTSHLQSPLLDFVAPTGGDAIYCVEEKGAVVALDPQTGQKRWRQMVLSGQEGEQLDGITGTAQAVVVYGSKMTRGFQRTEDDHVGVIGLSPQDGHSLWRHADWHLPKAGRTVQGKSAVVKDKIVVALEPAQVVAFQPNTGTVIWKHAYPDPAPLDPNARTRRQIPTLLFQPQAFEEGHVMVFTFRPSRHYELLDGQTDAVLKTIEAPSAENAPSGLVERLTALPSAHELCKHNRPPLFRHVRSQFYTRPPK